MFCRVLLCARAPPPLLAVFSGSIRANVNDMLPNSSLTTQLALSWPDPYFCNITSMTYNGAQKQWNGASYQGTVVLVKKGQCSPYTKCEHTLTLTRTHPHTQTCTAHQHRTAARAHEPTRHHITLTPCSQLHWHILSAMPSSRAMYCLVSGVWCLLPGA